MTLPSILRYADDAQDRSHRAQRRCAPAPQSAALIFPGDMVGESGLEAVLAVAVDVSVVPCNGGTEAIKLGVDGVDRQGESVELVVDGLGVVAAHRGILESSGAGG